MGDTAKQLIEENAALRMALEHKDNEIARLNANLEGYEEEVKFYSMENKELKEQMVDKQHEARELRQAIKIISKQI